MPTQVQFRRGNEGQNNNFKGAAGEISVNTSTNSVRVHNGITTGGFELARADLSNVGNVSLSGIVTATAFVGDGSGLTGIQDLTGPWVSGQVGIYTNSYVGIGTTNPQYDLHVIGNARITGILTIGNASITIDGNNNDINIGSGVTVYGNTGIISASAFYVGNVDLASASGYASTAGIATVASGLTTTASVNTSGILTATKFVGIGSDLTDINLNQLSDVDLTTVSPAPTQGQALVYNADGKWVPGALVGGVSYTSPEGDPQFDNVSLLLHMDGSNNGTTFVDSSKYNATITRGNNTITTTAQSKFGGSSAFFDGDNDYLSIADAEKFNFGTGDFTFECWARFNVLENQYQAIISQMNQLGGGNMSFWWGILGSPNNSIEFWYSSNGSAYNTISFPWSPGPTTGVWYHISFCRSGTDLRAYVNGNQIGSTVTNFTTSLFNSTVPLLIGIQDTTFFNYDFKGWIDDLRITKGVARYTTSSFTPPTVAFADSASAVSEAPSRAVWTPTSAGIHTLGSVGVGTTNPTSRLTVSGNALVSGVVTASSFVGDGSGLTNIVATGTGVEVRDNGSVVGTARTLDFGNNLDVTFSAGIMTVTGASGAQFLKNASGISTTSSVGIGTTQPVAKLHVNGAIALSASPIFMGKNTVDETVVIPSGYNAMSIGPILTVGTGVTVTVEAGANWFVLGQ